MPGYSGFSLLGNALRGHRHWPRARRNTAPQKHYDVVIIGAGGHGLATAYYLAKYQGVKNVVVLEKGYLGGGNSGRNTQVCRSNYFYPQGGAFYEHSLKLYENLASEVNTTGKEYDGSFETAIEPLPEIPSMKPKGQPPGINFA